MLDKRRTDIQLSNRSRESRTVALSSRRSFSDAAFERTVWNAVPGTIFPSSNCSHCEVHRQRAKSTAPGTGLKAAKAFGQER